MLRKNAWKDDLNRFLTQPGSREMSYVVAPAVPSDTQAPSVHLQYSVLPSL